MIEVAENVYHIPLFPRNMVNAYIVDGFLVDAGVRSSERKLLQAIDQFGRHKIQGHVLTHAHPDHQGASAAICQALNISLWCGTNDADAMESGLFADVDVNNLIIRFQKRYWVGPPYPVQRRLQEGDRVGEFEVLDVPGHAPGHIALWRERDGVLIAGDVINNASLATTLTGVREPPAGFTTDVALNRASIKKLARLCPTIVCVGHGPVLHDADQLTALANQLPD
ncbi:MAG: MBL fold metallo-hydrolase [Ardenticatenaceae bacterium]|nr:MBL fold metallo-hydrolase [Ardenticatenaceae bacterium]